MRSYSAEEQIERLGIGCILEENSDMRKIFMETYGIEMKFPAYYYNEAKFVPKNPEFVLSTSWHIIPDMENVEI